MSEIEWDDDYDALPPKLEYYGKKVFYPRIMHSTMSTLHQAQKDALESLQKWFKNEHDIYKDTKDCTAVVVMPTGTGKTGVICCLPYVMGTLSPEIVNIRKSILIITPGIDIFHQLKESLSGSSTAKSFLENRGLLQKKDIKKGTNYLVHYVESTDDVYHLDKNEFDITLSNSQKWRLKTSKKYANYEKLPNDLFSLVIVDEAHHLPARQWSEIVEKFRPHAKIIFFTATPNRADGREITVDGTLSTKGCAYKLTREQAISQKLIRDVNIKVLSEKGLARKVVKISTSEQDDEKKVRETSERMHYAEPVLIEMKRRMEMKNREQPLPGGQKHASIVITKKRLEANLVKQICIEKLGFSAASVRVVHTAEIKTKTNRAAVIKEIKDGHIQLVIVVKMLLEGFDHPPFSIAGIVTKIRSPVKFAQFVGRIQRIVRPPNKKGENEKGITGDVITHEYFEQEQLFRDVFEVPRIAEQENKDLDENGEDSDDEEDFQIDEYNMVDEDDIIIPAEDDEETDEEEDEEYSEETVKSEYSSENSD